MSDTRIYNSNPNDNDNQNRRKYYDDYQDQRPVKNAEKEKPSYWNTLPGMLTGVAAFTTAMVSLIGVFLQLGVISPRSDKKNTDSVALVTPPPIANNTANISDSYVIIEGDWQDANNPTRTYKIEQTANKIHLIITQDTVGLLYNISGNITGYEITNATFIANDDTRGTAKLNVTKNGKQINGFLENEAGGIKESLLINKK